MKMKSAKKKSFRNKAKTEEKLLDVVVVKTESELEEGSHEVYMNGDDLNIQIKEEPDSQDISEEHNGDTSSCFDTNEPDTVMSDVHYQQALIKEEEECDSDHQPEYEFSEAAVKEESESWIKEEREDEDEEEAEEREELCTGRGVEVYEKHKIPE